MKKKIEKAEEENQKIAKKQLDYAQVIFMNYLIKNFWIIKKNEGSFVLFH